MPCYLVGVEVKHALNKVGTVHEVVSFAREFQTVSYVTDYSSEKQLTSVQQERQCVVHTVGDF